MKKCWILALMLFALGQAEVVIPARGPQQSAAQAQKTLHQDMDGKIAEFLKLHNDARAEVGAPPLQWDPQLADAAQKWADHLAQTNTFTHHPEGDFGENLATYFPQNGERPVHGAQLWFSEKKLYHRENFSEKTPCGHYTQMVWKESLQVGFGMAINAKGQAILVACYSPPGNMLGEPAY